MVKSIGNLSKIIFQATESGIVTIIYPLPIFFPPINQIYFPQNKTIYQKSSNNIYSKKRSYPDRKIKIRQK